MTKLEERLTEIAYKLKITHLNAGYTTLKIFDDIYKTKKPNEPLILSQGHSFLALAVILEKYEGLDAYKLNEKYGTHPTRCKEDHLDCSTGSLGQGMTIALGLALANRKRRVFCLTSDGEMTEGSCWEVLKLADEHHVTNLRIIVNANGFSAYQAVDLDKLEKRMKAFFPVKFVRTNMDKYPRWLSGVDGHYQGINSPERYKEMLLC
jgi:transketolase